jgi:hypothetical protein
LLPVFGGLILAGAGSLNGLRPLVGIGRVIAGLGAALGLRESIRVGILRTNWGEVRRDRSPLFFRLEAGFWIVFIAAWTILGALYALGLIGSRPA